MLVVHYGALAQLVERLHGMQEVNGSIPLCSTKVKLPLLWEFYFGASPDTNELGVRAKRSLCHLINQVYSFFYDYIFRATFNGDFNVQLLMRGEHNELARSPSNSLIRIDLKSYAFVTVQHGTFAPKV